ncbi:MAG: prolyl tripeptidyl peptidase [Melioribacteraceae bacterium]|nr:MAG: prolyl tripeptidyl peptidase [Melioribacteraceae bacterium]
MKRLIIFTLLLVSIQVFAQKDFTIEDVVFHSYGRLVPHLPTGITTIPGSDSYSYVVDRNEQFVLAKSSVTSEKTEDILYLNVLARLLKQVDIEPPARFPKVKWLSHNEFYFKIKTSYVFFSIDNNEITKVITAPENADNLSLSPDKKKIAYTIDNNLWYVDSDGKTVAISNEENKDIVYGQSVHRNEFGISKGIYWSADSKNIAFYRKDESMVTDYPIINFDETPATLENIKYPMAGQASHQVTVGIFNVESSETQYLATGEPKDQYLTSLTWHPKGSSFYIGHLNRDQNHFQLKEYDVSSGNYTKTLFEEKNDKYVENEHPLYFLPNDDSKFLWLTEKDGFEHMYLYNTEGSELDQITKGNWVVKEYFGFDKTGNVLFTSTKDGVEQNHLYSVNLNDKNITKLTNEQGSHNISFEEGNQIFIDKFSSLNDPGYAAVKTVDGKSEKVLEKFDNPLTEYKIGKTEIFTVQNDENVEFHCRAVYPPDFDPTKKYPVIVYTYGGPHVQLVKDSWAYGRYRFWFMKMAQEGYIVFTMDNRGTANRGRDFEQATFRKLGTVEVQDQIFALKKFMENPFVDPDRIGVFGWSYGGFMTTSLMLRSNDLFKVGVGGGAVIDWKYYEIMYTERYMDTPETNPEGYEEANLLNYIDNLNGKLLLVHGTSDPTVVWQHTIKFVQEATSKNKPLEYYPYVHHPHGVTGKDALNLYTKLTQYFIDNL